MFHETYCTLYSNEYRTIEYRGITRRIVAMIQGGVFVLEKQTYASKFPKKGRAAKRNHLSAMSPSIKTMDMVTKTIY